MKLVSYIQGEGGRQAAAAWISGDDQLVDIAAAQQWFASRRGASSITRTCVTSLTALVRDELANVRIQELQELSAQWDDAAACGDESALACLVADGSARIVKPFAPLTFRDFYAFEEHVRMCRRKRGLEMVPEWYEFPVFYFSNPNSFLGPDDAVAAPGNCRELDYELEVACVIGKPGYSVPAERADEYIAGYLILNDWSARDVQRAEVKVGLGPAKGKDFATSFGPYLVTKSELADIATTSERGLRHSLKMSARINGRTVSEGNLNTLYFTFAEMIERASKDTWLYPGDVIGSGTVGSGCILELGTDVVPWLTPGDVVELEVERLGTLRTPIVSQTGGDL